MKKIYMYDVKTGEYLFSENAEKSPLEKDVYLLPAFATFLVPPSATQYKTPVFNGVQWLLVSDYRKTKLFSTITGEEIKLELGNEPTESVTTKPRPSQYHKWTNKEWQLDTNEKRISLLADIAYERKKAESAGISVNSVTIQTDRESQAMLTAAYILLKDGIMDTIDYKTQEGFVQLGLQAISEISQSVSLHVQACFTKEKSIIELINKMGSDDLASAIAEDLWNAA